VGSPGLTPQLLDPDGACALAFPLRPPQGLYSTALAYMLEGCRARPSRPFGSNRLMRRARAPLSPGPCAELRLKEE
jgi:hypothetical protein